MAALVAILSLVNGAAHKPPPKKRSKSAVRRAVRPVSPALREAALARISARLTPAAGHFSNPAALQPFFALLQDSRATGQPVHILQFGDSHTASDDWVDAMRQFMQAKYGNGGPGFGMAGRPYRGYRRFDLAGNSSAGWETAGTVGRPGDGLLGLSGVAITSRSAGQTAWINTAAKAVELFYLAQPGGGAFSVDMDGLPLQTIETDDRLSTGIFSYQPPPGDHVFAVTTLSAAPVRLYGWVAQNPSGVTWETLGINGAQASLLLNGDDALWTQQIKSRNPALCVLAYGTNEANSRSFDPASFRADLLRVIARFREAVPASSLLLVGPPDCGRDRPLLHLDEVIDVERQTAGEAGIAFWDWRDRMGGSRATVTWVRAGLGQPDYIHLTGAGYRALGQALAGDLDLESRAVSSGTQESP